MTFPLIAGVASAIARKLATEGVKKVASKPLSDSAKKTALEKAKQEAREEARAGATTTIENGVPVTRYPPLREVERPITADVRAQATRSPRAMDSTRRLSDESFESYKKGGTVRGAGCATKGVKKCKVY